MKFLREIKAVTEFLFFLEGFLILCALVLWRNDFLVYEAELFLRYVDLPFLFNALLLAGSTVRLSFSSKEIESGDPDGFTENPILDTIIVAVGLIIFALILFVDLGFPDKI